MQPQFFFFFDKTQIFSFLDRNVATNLISIQAIIYLSCLVSAYFFFRKQYQLNHSCMIFFIDESFEYNFNMHIIKKKEFFFFFFF